ncbi:hypothetical protein LTR53_019755, partial [Teratosphaeriaceae sp. CCFEE 6253]
SQGQQGSSSKANIGLTNDAKGESLVTNAKNGVSDTTSTSQADTAGHIDVNSVNPQRGNNTANVEFKNESKSATEEHQGKGVYEFHQETSSKGSLNQNFNGGNAIAEAGKA